MSTHYIELPLFDAGQIAAVPAVSDLPTIGITDGAIRYVESVTSLYYWTGTVWLAAVISPAVNAVGALTNDGAGHLTWGGSVVARYVPGSAKQKSQITCNADTLLAPLNNTYYNYYSAKDVTQYVMWFNVGGTGTDPLIPGTFSVEVDINALDDAPTVAMALGNAIGAEISATVPGVVGAVVTMTNDQFGLSTATSDGAVPTGFTFATLVPGFDPSSSATGTDGMVKYDNNFFYICVGTNTWKRVAITTW